MKFIKLFSVLLTVTACFAADRVVSEKDTTLISENHTNAFKWSPLTPGPDDGKIAYVAARVLEGNHYLQKPIDDVISSKFLDKYLNALDPAHLLFFQSDLAEFEKWRTKLDDMMLRPEKPISPAEIIFNRFIKHFEGIG